MTFERLTKHCLAYLEQDTETNVMSEDVSFSDLENNDTFAEYVKNIEPHIFMGLTRFATSQILPLKEFLAPKGTRTFTLTETRNNKQFTLAHKVRSVFVVDNNGEIIKNNVNYMIVGNKIYINEQLLVQDFKEIEDESSGEMIRVYGNCYYGTKNDNNEYCRIVVLYNPKIDDLKTYLYDDKYGNVDEVYKLELGEDGLGVPDEMLIQIKYLVYGNMKLEENASVAINNTNKFESYLNETARNLVENYETEITTFDWSDAYGN